MDTKYVYKDKVKDGYKKFTISKKDQNDIFKYRKAKKLQHYEYYIKDNHIILECLPTKFACLLSTLLLPVGLLMCGFSNYKEVWNDMFIRMWWAKEKGSFIADAIYKRENDDTFDRLIKVAKWK